MEQHLKKRILGAFVTVVALAVAMPVVLDGSRSQIQLRSDIPVQPEMEPWQPLENERRVRIELEDLAAGKTEEEVTLPEVRVVKQDDSAAPRTKGDRAALDDQKQAYAWSVQLGAFEKRANAHALRDQLRAKGYKAYVQEFAAEGLTRVYVGPELQRSKIEAIQKQLSAELKQDDFHIKRFKAES